MKYFLLLTLLISSTYTAEKKTKKRKFQLDNVNLEKEIFMRSYYKEHSFELLKQISERSVANKYIFDSLVAQGMQKYCKLAVQWDADKDGELKPFYEFSLSELESIQVD